MGPLSENSGSNPTGPLSENSRSNPLYSSGESVGSIGEESGLGEEWGSGDRASATDAGGEDLVGGGRRKARVSSPGEVKETHGMEARSRSRLGGRRIAGGDGRRNSSRRS
jgi:hypothetical protein